MRKQKILDLEEKITCYYQEEAAFQQILVDSKLCSYKGECKYKDKIGIVSLCYQQLKDYKKWKDIY